ncbi:tripartite tricarboxylate transporter substrate-binding protein [Aureimonas sp. ME7]|uniref:Bug family tripartite tricarboxylate transporter substrate binding protein n=1 Tax=Aureimonas sp. ME7 TaxID=2744252 RepID=UPI0015F5051B|nr:tripartite tricarboxylate transporter substrate-binding protein [Aureimonas sp. ME7]
MCKIFGMTRRGMIRLMGGAALGALAPLLQPDAAIAQDAYPNAPVTIVLPFGPGGIADITARIVAEGLTRKLGQQFLVQNQPGAGGSTAARIVLSAPADGYTLAFFTNGTSISVPLFAQLPFDPVQEFVPVSSLAYFDFVFATRKGGLYDSMEALLAASRAEPGVLNVGTVNVGSSQNLAAELFRTTSGIEFTVVPYRATPDLLVGLLGEEVDLIIDSEAALKSALDDGQALAVASSGPKRSTVLPDVPTAAEAGVAGFDVTSWNAIFAPAGTPEPVVTQLNTAVNEILADPATIQRFRELGVEARGSTPQAIGERMQADIVKWGAVIEKAGIPKM